MAATTETLNGNGGSVHGVFGRERCLTEVVDEGSAQSFRYYISRRTVLEMLKDRGFDVADSDLTRSVTEFRSVFGNSPDVDSLRFCVSLRSNPLKKTLVIFLGTDEIKIANIRAVYGQILNKESLHGLILILQSKMNHFAKKELEKFPFKVEVFQITDLLVNITKHVLQPKLDILTADQKQQVLNKYKLEDKQLPRVLESDAIVRYYGLQKGQVVKIAYSDGVFGPLVTYRCGWAGFQRGVGARLSETRDKETLQTSSFIDASWVLGRMEDQKKIIKLLVSDEHCGNDVGIIPVVGMGGLGKITKLPTKSILESVERKSCDLMDLNILQTSLQDMLRGKRFLVVLDDVWHERKSDWDVVRLPFRAEAFGSKIIVTTRSEKVASIMGIYPPFRLEGLSDDDFWLLFKGLPFPLKID
ncbi:unnamed protein product [Dovyalis caffra]|uniref:NB-ARC domain-containing protein n=1 Tax=Dovyalis caffra TaxID=77055 RepID=A0AAV1RLD7_9ROSI|nr:unnamed protein product [Dovyalis caffra]